MGRSERVAAVAVLAALTAAVPAGAGDSADRSAGPLVRWVAMLNDADPDTRDTGREHLLGLSVDELPALSKAARQCAPLTVQQTLGLQDVVRYVLTRDALQKLPSQHSGLLGVRWRRPADPFADSDDSGDAAGGASVEMCLPGFVGYRYLRAGDRVVGIYDTGVEQTVDDNGDLRRSIGSHAPGDTITLDVIRAGRAMNVTLSLDARPVFDAVKDPDADQHAVDQVIDDMTATAQAYFDRLFSGLAPGDA